MEDYHVVFNDYSFYAETRCPQVRDHSLLWRQYDIVATVNWRTSGPELEEMEQMCKG